MKLHARGVPRTDACKHEWAPWALACSNAQHNRPPDPAAKMTGVIAQYVPWYAHIPRHREIARRWQADNARIILRHEKPMPRACRAVISAATSVSDFSAKLNVTKVSRM